MFAATAMVALLTLSTAGECVDPTLTSIKNFPSSQHLEATPDRVQPRCRIVDADALAQRSSLEFVDVRTQPIFHAAPGLRVLSFSQLEERPPSKGSTRVLLGNGLDDDSIARQCKPRTAAQALVLRGGVRAWNEVFSTSAPTSVAETANEFAEVEVSEALSASARFAFDLKRDEDLVRLLDARKHPYVDVGAINALGNTPLVYLIDRLGKPLRDRPLNRFYLRGGAESLRLELLNGPARAQSASLVLRRPCYLP